MNSSSILLPPSGGARSIFIQTRNTSENQTMNLSGLATRLSSKGYDIVSDPFAAAYWLQAQIIYCHKAAAGLTAEAITKSGFGTGLGSGGDRPCGLFRGQ